jgi:hypothetical protein
MSDKSKAYGFSAGPSGFGDDLHGAVVDEDGAVIGSHISSSIGWLKMDLRRCVPDDVELEWVDAPLEHPKTKHVFETPKKEATNE